MRLVEHFTHNRRTRCPFIRLQIAAALLAIIACIRPIALAQATGADDSSSLPNKDAQAQTPALAIQPLQLKSLPRNIFTDQVNFWSTPFHMSQSQWQWTVPVGLVGAGLLASDTAIEAHVPTSPTTASHAVTFSNAGVAAMVGIGAGMYFWGHGTGNDQARETGLLAGEAAANAFLTTTVFKYAFGRERPFTGSGRGLFFQGGSSFPSEHASVSWAIASVVAHEYPGPLTQLLAYGLAGSVSAARVVGHKHFATDAIVGSALGWYLGRQVFRSHSRYSSADIAKWGTFTRGAEDTAHQPRNMGSPFVPLDSWIYPALERLIAMGYIQSGFLGMRPWTRMECARLLQEANLELEYFSDDVIARKLYVDLGTEFQDEIARLGGETNLGASIDSVYSRFTGISGTPLQDGFHFGQTLINDFGRPYAQGLNNVTGISGHAVAGPLSFYFRGEYQHAPSTPALSVSAAQVIQAVDGLPSTPNTDPIGAVNRFDVVEGYVAMQLNNWQFSFGKQALWWGADQSGAMLFSTNSAPILSLQINRVSPFKVPLLGATRFDFMVGRLSGYHWVFGADSGFVGSWSETLSNQPFIVGQKISFKPIANLEFGLSLTSLFGGPGVPATAGKLVKSLYSTSNGPPGTPEDPGDRRGGFDFAYRFPQLNGLTFYVDAFTDDQANPWLAWNKSAVTSGLYLPQMPRLSKLDLRVEGVYSDPPGGNATVQHGFFYINSRFKSGYTNNGDLIGSWIGRQGQGAQVWATYWLSPRNNVQFNFRHQKVSQQFIPDGGSLTDIGVSADYWFRNNFGVSARLQRERWLFPVIQPDVSHNVTASVELLFEPKRLRSRSHSGEKP